jgi:hypothetical protein
MPSATSVEFHALPQINQYPTNDSQVAWSWGGAGRLNPIVLAMRRPVTTLISLIAFFCGDLTALENMCVDILASLIHVKRSSS